MMRDWLARHHVWMLITGGLCLTAALVIGWSLMGQATTTTPDRFADLETEFDAPAVILGAAADGPVLPPVEFPAANFETLRTALLPTFGDGPDHMTTAHFTTASAAERESAPQNPVWLSGTIEPLEELSAPSVVPIDVRHAIGSERFRR